MFVSYHIISYQIKSTHITIYHIMFCYSLQYHIVDYTIVYHSLSKKKIGPLQLPSSSSATCYGASPALFVDSLGQSQCGKPTISSPNHKALCLAKRNYSTLW